MSYEVWGEPEEVPECRYCEESAEDYKALEKTADDLAALVKRLAYLLRKSEPGSNLPEIALDYLVRNKLEGSPLRETPNAKLTGRGADDEDRAAGSSALRLSDGLEGVQK